MRTHPAQHQRGRRCALKGIWTCLPGLAAWPTPKHGTRAMRARALRVQLRCVRAGQLNAATCASWQWTRSCSRARARRAAERGPAQAGGQPDPLPAAPLLHSRLHAADEPRQPAVPRALGARADAADVGRQEHDVRGRPAARALPDRLRGLPRPHVLQGGARTLAAPTHARRAARALACHWALRRALRSLHSLFAF